MRTVIREAGIQIERERAPSIGAVARCAGLARTDVGFAAIELAAPAEGHAQALHGRIPSEIDRSIAFFAFRFTGRLKRYLVRVDLEIEFLRT